MSDKNFKVKNGLDAVGPITISPSSSSITSLIINSVSGGTGIIFNRNGSQVGSIDEWGTYSGSGINIVQPWYVRTPGLESQSFFWVGSGARSAAGFAGTNSGTNPVIYIAQVGTATNDLTQWIKPDNTILAKVDYLGNITANDLTLAGNLTVNGTTTNLNSTNLIVEDKNIIIADVAAPTDTTADGAGITVKGATDKTFSWSNSTKSFTSSEPLIINNTSATTIPLIVKGYDSQSANLFLVQDSTGSNLLRVQPPVGTRNASQDIYIRPGGTGGIAQVGNDSFAIGLVTGGGGSIFLGTPGGGSSLQIVTSDTFNRYKIQGTGTGVAPIFTTDGLDTDVNMNIYPKGAGKIGINNASPTGYVHAISSSSSVVGLIVQGATGQTSTNIFEVQRAGGGDPSFTVSHNYIDLNRNTTAAASMTVYGPNAGAVPLYVRGRASQTANLQEWQNSDSVVVAQISATGTISTKPVGFSGNLNTAIISVTDRASTWAPGNFAFRSDSGGIPRFSFTAPNSATEALSINGNSVGVQTPSPTAHFQVTSNGASNIVSIVKGAASQTANLQEWQDSAGTVLNTITSSGTLVIGGTTPVNSSFGITLVNKTLASYYSANNSNYNTSFNFTRGNTTGNWMGIGTVGDSTNGVASIAIGDTGGNTIFTVGQTGNTAITLKSATSIGLIIKAAASQTANLQEWKNVSDATNAYMRVDGFLYAGGGVNGVSINAGNYVSGGILTAQGYATTQTTAIIKAVSSQTADLQQWQNSAGTVTASVDPAGNITDASNTAWLSPIGSGSNDAPTIQALIDAGKKEIRLGSGQWTFSTRIKVPNGVTIRGTGTSRSSTTGTRVNAVALIASEGTVRDIMFTGAGENAQSELGGGGIAVLGGRVIDCSVTDSRWVLAPTRQPHGYLKNFMSRMQGGYGSVKVAILGDSLSENTSTTSWYGYLFDTSTTATGYYLGSYFGHQIAPSEVDNMAIGGQGAYLLSAQLAMTKDTVRTGDYVNQVLDGDNVSTSPFFNRNYNLAILAIGQNGGEDWKAHLEYTVKSIRDRGIDVIILTQNPAAGAPTSRAGDEYFYRSMAETYGCLLIDTQAYFRLEVEFGRALGTTADLFGDGIHQSALGHQLYAKAILNGILDYDSTVAVPANKTVVARSYSPAQGERATALPLTNAYYLVKKPDPSRGISGVTYTSATDSSIRNPIYGRGTTTNSVATLASGGYATWGVEYATSAYIIYRENSTANTLTVSLQGGTSTLATLSTGVTDGRTSIQKVVLSGYGVVNRAIRITNTSGNPVQIYGVVFETHADVAFNRNTDGSYPGVKLNGSWAYANLLSMVDYGSYLTPYTSTTNDSVTFKFYGDGLRFSTSYGKNSGIIQVKIDDTTYTAVDTYLNISEYGVYTHFYGGLQYGLHTATITLTGANASVTNNLGDGARFGLHRIAAVRSGWYLTQDQQLAPNSDISAKVNSLASPTIGSTGGANIATFYNGTNGYGAGAINSSGTFNINGANMGFPYTSSGATLNVNAGASSIVPLTVRGSASQTADLQQWQNSSGTALAKVDSLGNFTATSKSFDIEHPTKENMRLRYGSLEGPENGVYIRGTAECNIIELPDYWTGLVYEDSITVSLTSVGSAQNIYVEKIENNKVYIGGNLEKAFFTVYGERKDIDKLTVEY